MNGMLHCSVASCGLDMQLEGSVAPRSPVDLAASPAPAPAPGAVAPVPAPAPAPAGALSSQCSSLMASGKHLGDLRFRRNMGPRPQGKPPFFVLGRDPHAGLSQIGWLPFGSPLSRP